jgi:hypothetical protein
LRFQSLYIPRGAQIDAAYLEFTVDEAYSVTSAVDVRAEAADTANAFTSTGFNLTTRSLTAASVAWSIPAWPTVGATQRSPDISAALQEVIARNGWTPNASVVFVISGTGHRTAEAYEGLPGAAALLHVEYSTQALPNEIPVADFTFNVSGLTATLTDTSVDNDGNITGWLWDFGDNTGSTLRNPVHTYSGAGTYSATLVVTDNEGASDSASYPVTASLPPGCG